MCPHLPPSFSIHLGISSSFSLSFSAFLFQGLNNQADLQKPKNSVICRLIIGCEKWISNVEQKICRGFGSLFCVSEAGAECFPSYSGRACSFLHDLRAWRHFAAFHLLEWGALLCAVQLNTRTKAMKLVQLITYQDYWAGLGFSCSFQQKKKK